MGSGLQDKFKKSGSRFQFNIDCIAEKYCSGSESREKALETLQRDFGEACIASPVLELKDSGDRVVCQRLNQEFEKQYSKHQWMVSGADVAEDASAYTSSRRCSLFGQWKTFFMPTVTGRMPIVGATARKETSQSKKASAPAHLANMFTNSIEEGPYEPETSNIGENAVVNYSNMVGNMLTRLVEEGPLTEFEPMDWEYEPTAVCVNGRTVDVTLAPVKEGPVEIYTMPHVSKGTPRKLHHVHPLVVNCWLNLRNDETLLEGWFRNAEMHWNDDDFVQDHTFRSRLAFRKRNDARRSLGYEFLFSPKTK